ncbi:MAG: redox-regulated ATPase YchF [Chloroflexi bacterium]|nr:redox-regulated ATPase YchF [Chloroflexota bacterium]
MDIAIIGLPQSGKTTVFDALTRGQSSATGSGGPGAQMRVGVVKVPDPRVAVLAEMYDPKKLVYPEIKYLDLPGQEDSGPYRGIGGRNRNILQEADAYLMVLRTFNDPGVHHPLGGVDPGRDLANMLAELTLADLEVLERALERLDDSIKKSKSEERPVRLRHLDAARKVKENLEEGVPLRRQELTNSQAEFLADFQLLTAKPIIVAFNTGESGPDIVVSDLDVDPAEAASLGQVNLCGKLEADLVMMSGEEEALFRHELGVEEPATERVIRASYETLGLVSFLTIGDDEVRAWSVPHGLAAQKAAGTIHTDFYRGFIRAEVIPYDDLVRCGSIAQGRKEGVLRSEGKTYPVQDGDVIDFLINV